MSTSVDASDSRARVLGPFGSNNGGTETNEVHKRADELLERDTSENFREYVGPVVLSGDLDSGDFSFVLELPHLELSTWDVTSARRASKVTRKRHNGRIVHVQPCWLVLDEAEFGAELAHPESLVSDERGRNDLSVSTGAGDAFLTFADGPNITACELNGTTGNGAADAPVAVAPSCDDVSAIA